MYNLPYIPYGIFAFVILATGLLAWKKGVWAAVSSLALTLVTTGVIVGVVFAFYDQIAILFKHYIVSHFGGEAGFDFTFIAHSARPQIVAICIAIGFIPVFLIVFGISYPVYRLLKKRDFPMTIKFLSKNSKKVKIKNKRLNKAGAVVATSVAALGTAGVAASASSVVFSTTRSYNGFNDFVSGISLGASYGFGTDNVSYHKMYDFIPLTKNAALMKIASVFAPSSTQVISDVEIQAIIHDKDFDKLKDIISNSKTSAILNVITSPFIRDKETISYANLKEEQSLPKNLWRPLENESSPIAYSLSMKNLDKVFGDNYFGFDDATVAKIVDWVKTNGIQKFETTEAYKLWQERINMINEDRVKLNDAKAKLSKREAFKQNYISSLANAQSALGKAYSEFEKQINNYNTAINVGGTIDNAQKLIASAVGNRDSKATEAKRLGDIFESQSGISYPKDDGGNLVMNQESVSLDVTVAGSNAPYQLKKSAYEDLLTKQDNFNKQNKRYVDASNAILALNEQISELTKSAQKLTDDANTLETNDLATLNQQIETLRNQLASETDPDKKADIDRQIQGATNTQTELNKTITQKRQDAQEIQGTIDSKNIDLSFQQSEQISASGEMQKLNPSNSLTRDVAAAKKAYEDARAIAQGNLNNYLAAYNIWANSVNELASKINNAKNDIEKTNGFIRDINTANLEWNQAENDIISNSQQIAILDWDVVDKNALAPRFEKTFKDLNISNIDYYKTLTPAQTAIQMVGQNPAVDAYAITKNQGSISGLQKGDLDVSTTLTNVDIDRHGRDDVEENIPKGNYIYSIPYLSQTASAGIKEITVDKQLINKDLSKVIETKSEQNITSGTEGLIEMFNFNIENNQKSINEIFIPYRDEKKQEFDKNIDYYLNILKVHLGKTN